MGIFAAIIVCIFGITAIAGAIVMIRERDPARGAVALFLSMASVAVIFFAIGAHVVGLLQLIIGAAAAYQVRRSANRIPKAPVTHPDHTPLTRIIGIPAIILLLGLFIFDLIAAGKGILILPIALRNFLDLSRIIPALFAEWLYPLVLVIILIASCLIALAHFRDADFTLTKTDGGER